MSTPKHDHQHEHDDQHEQGQTAPAPRRRRGSVWPPVAVSVAAAAIALTAWLSTRDPGADETTADPAASSPAVTDPAATGHATLPPEDAAPTGEPQPPAAGQASEPLTIGDVEVTPPPPGEFAFPTGDQDSWVAPLEERGADGPYALGEADAPVVMLMYSEFQCPFCRSFATETMPELMPYIEDGTLRVQWRDFPYLGPESSLAALAGRTAAEQDMFWEFHDALFALNLSPNTGAISEESVADLAEDAGLDRASFEASLNTIEQQEAMRDDQDEGVALGVVGTPSFLINGIPIRGAQPTEIFLEAVMDAAAARGR